MTHACLLNRRSLSASNVYFVVATIFLVGILVFFIKSSARNGKRVGSTIYPELVKVRASDACAPHNNSQERFLLQVLLNFLQLNIIIVSIDFNWPWTLFKVSA
jgi:hypothetical protein